MNKRYLKEKFELNVIEDINEEEEDGFNEEEEDSFSEEECWPERNIKYYSIITGYNREKRISYPRKCMTPEQLANYLGQSQICQLFTEIKK